MNLSVDVERAFDKGLYPCMIKIMQKEVDTKGTYLNLKKIKATSDKSKVNIICSKNLKTFPLKLGTGQDAHSFHFVSI